MKKSHHPSHGFRFSMVDGMAIVICVVVTWLLFSRLGHFVWLFPFVLGHFFLFCNVFRIHRNLELIWAGVFLVNYSVCAVLEIDWMLIFAFQIPITVLLIAVEVRKSRYHGIFSTKSSDSD